MPLWTTPPGRRLRVLKAGGDSELTPSADVDLVDSGKGSFVHCVGDLLAVGRVGRIEVFSIVVGELDPVPCAHIDRIELTVVCAVVRIDDLLAAGRIGRKEVISMVVGELGLTSPTGVDGVDLGVVSLVSYIGYFAVFARKGSLRLP